MNHDKKQRIDELIEKTIETSVGAFFKGKTVQVTHVLDLIFPKERRIRSLIGGLETSLGTRLWEPLAKAFAKENEFNVKDEKALNGRVPIIPKQVRHLISDFNDRKRRNPDLKVVDFCTELAEQIKQSGIRPEGYQKMPKGEGVDIWIEKSGVEYLIDFKTTQINAGSGPKFLTNQLNWIAYRLLENTDAKVVPLLAFPFNPHQGSFWAKEGGKSAPLIAGEEARVADEIWNFLLGEENSTKLIMDGFAKLGKSGFGEKFRDVFEPPKEPSADEIVD